MATYAIGDIHGCLTALEQLVGTLSLSDSDTLVLLGDYIDRGPDSKGVIDWILNYEGPAELVTLRGNHEVMMMDARTHPDKFFSWQHFGGEETLLSYHYENGTEWQDCVPDAHWTFFEQTLPYYANDTQIFVHASVKPKKPLDKQDDRSLYWRKISKPKAYSRDHLVICGHTTQYEGKPENHTHTIFIDTYAYGDQWLTALNADNLNYWQANQHGELRSGSLQSEQEDT